MTIHALLKCLHHSLPGSRHANIRPKSQRPALASRAKARCQGRRAILFCRQNHGCVLPPLVRRAHAEAGERALLRHARCRRTGGLSRLQALQAAWRNACRGARRAGHPGLRLDRGQREHARAGSTGEAGQGEPVAFASCIQSGDRRHATRVCSGATRATRTRRTHARRGGDAGDVRRGLQLQRTLLRKIQRHPGHDTRAVPRGWGSHRYSLCTRRVFVGRGVGGRY